MWLSNRDYLRYPTYSAALAIATASGRGAEFMAFCESIEADYRDGSRELCRGWDAWRKAYPEVAAFRVESESKSKVVKLPISFVTSAEIARKFDVCWAKGLLVAARYKLTEDYQSRHGYPVANLQNLDTGFWTWAERHQITLESCVKIWDAPPVLEWDEFCVECIEGSDIRPPMLALNVQRVENSGYGSYEVLELLNIPATRFFESTDGVNWNRPGDKFGGQIYAFRSNESGFFNAKPRIPVWDSERGRYRKYEARRKERGTGAEGNRIFFPDVDAIACERLMANFDLFVPVDPSNYWQIVRSYSANSGRYNRGCEESH
ncbi:MAG: hypothetical protein HC778_00125 [Chamaesiphon sp. CSU_1_12]|nr:hypothetical protein [Chamaesiphon sp. CSU_1_12]